MNILDRIESLLKETRRRTLGAILERMEAQKQKRNEVAFSIALIALSAKMAKADGIVTDDEIAAFQNFFSFSDEDGQKVRMIYQLAQQDVAGYDEYLRQVARIFADAPSILEDVLDCLFHIAIADGVAHPRELELLDRTAEIFGLSASSVRRMRAVHLGLGEEDPYLILGLEPGVDAAGAKKQYHRLVKDHHPDALIARGVPADLVKISEGRMAAINDAYEQILTEIS